MSFCGEFSVFPIFSLCLGVLAVNLSFLSFHCVLAVNFFFHHVYGARIPARRLPSASIQAMGIPLVVCAAPTLPH